MRQINVLIWMTSVLKSNVSEVTLTVIPICAAQRDDYIIPLFYWILLRPLCDSKKMKRLCVHLPFSATSATALSRRTESNAKWKAISCSDAEICNG